MVNTMFKALKINKLCHKKNKIQEVTEKHIKMQKKLKANLIHWLMYNRNI